MKRQNQPRQSFDPSLVGFGGTGRANINGGPFQRPISVAQFSGSINLPGINPRAEIGVRSVLTVVRQSDKLEIGIVPQELVSDDSWMN